MVESALAVSVIRGRTTAQLALAELDVCKGILQLFLAFASLSYNCASASFSLFVSGHILLADPCHLWPWPVQLAAARKLRGSF